MVQTEKYMNLGATTTILNSLLSKPLHVISLETYEPRSYYTNSNLASFGAITWENPFWGSSPPAGRAIRHRTGFVNNTGADSVGDLNHDLVKLLYLQAFFNIN